MTDPRAPTDPPRVTVEGRTQRAAIPMESEEDSRPRLPPSQADMVRAIHDLQVENRTMARSLSDLSDDVAELAPSTESDPLRLDRWHNVGVRERYTYGGLLFLCVGYGLGMPWEWVSTGLGLLVAAIGTDTIRPSGAAPRALRGRPVVSGAP